MTEIVRLETLHKKEKTVLRDGEKADSRRELARMSQGEREELLVKRNKGRC